MNIIRYTFTIFLIIIIIFCLGIFTIYKSDISGTIKQYFYNIIYTSIQYNNNNIPTLVSIRSITSERYLYTLTKSIENKLCILAHASIGIESDYRTFDTITLQNDNFVFTIHNRSIELPVSSYFFDIWNKQSKEIALQS